MAKKNFSESVNGVASVASTKCINGAGCRSSVETGVVFVGTAIPDVVNHVRGKMSAERASGVAIQTKYCSAASTSIDAAFENGVYRYPGQVIEVPKDQYTDAVRIMRGRISNGQVPGVSDPGMAEQLVVKGHNAYDDAVRIAKAVIGD